MEIIMGLTEGFITNALYDVAKKILRKDPIRSALDETIDEITWEKQDGWYELREIDRNQIEIFNNINIIEEATFLKILIDNDVLPETASRLYKKFSEKFNDNIKEAAKKEPEVFFNYAIREFERNKTNNEELIKLLTGFAYKNEVYLDRIIKHFKELEKRNQNKFEIGHQTAEIIYNAAGDIIFQNPMTPIKIPNIEETLKKGRKLEGDFFKEEPRWIDFEGGFIVERNEVNEIIKKLTNERTQLIMGNPASGKSVILKNVGFRLAKDNKNVYIVELKQHSRNEINLFFEYIPKISDEDSIIIVDDAHLNFDDCDKLIEDFENGGKGNLIIGSRETEEIIKGHLKGGSEFRDLIEEEKCIRIKAEGVTEEMIRTFLEKKHKEYNFSAERIKIVSDNLEKYKNDLWHLSWALKAYNPEKNSVSKEEICEKIRDSIRKIEVGKGQDELNAEDIFLPLSIFYRFEIPIERNYLEEQIGIEGNIINQLIGLQEIRETEETHKILSLHHSSIAELFFRAYLRYHDLGRINRTKILNQKDEKDLYFPFYQYITSADRNIVDIVISLHRDFSDEKGGLTLLRKLVEQDEIQKSIVIGIDKEEDIGKVGRCLLSIANTNKEIATKLVGNIYIIGLKNKMSVTGTDSSGNTLCLAGISNASKETGMELVDTIKATFDAEESRENIYGSILNLALADVEVAFEVVSKINIDILILKLDKEKDIEKVGLCVSGITRISEEVALKLADSIDINSIIEKGENLVQIGTFMGSIANANINFETKISEKYDVDLLSSKIEKNKRIEDVGWFVGRKVNKYLAMKLVDSVIKRIEIEEDIEKVGRCVWEFSRGNKEITLKLVDKIDIYALESKIEKEEDIGKIGSCVIGIAEANEDLGLKLINNIDIYALESKIEKEEDIRKIGGCVQGFARANEDLGLKLINGIDLETLALKVDKEENIEMIGAFVDTIAMGSEEAGLKLANNINIETLVSKIENEDIEKIKRCLSGISRANKEVAKEIATHLNPKLREELRNEKIIGN